MCHSPRYILNPFIKKLQEKGEFDSHKTFSKNVRFINETINVTDKGVFTNQYDNTYSFTDDHGNTHHVKHYIKVGCGKCEQCIRQNVNQMLSRMQIEMNNHSKYALFLTLTYSDEFVPLVKVGYDKVLPTLQLSDFQKFMKRFRTNLVRDGHEVESLKYFVVGEYGFKNTNNKRPHYHLLLFYDKLGINYLSDYIHKSWSLGHITILPVCDAMLRYCANAHATANKLFPNDLGTAKPFARWSKGFGLPNKEDYTYIKSHGKMYVDNKNYSLGRYLTDKCFSVSEQKSNVIHKVKGTSNKNDNLITIQKYLKTNKVNLSLNEFSDIIDHINSDNRFKQDYFYKKTVLKRK